MWHKEKRHCYMNNGNWVGMRWGSPGKRKALELSLKGKSDELPAQRGKCVRNCIPCRGNTVFKGYCIFIIWSTEFNFLNSQVKAKCCSPLRPLHSEFPVSPSLIVRRPSVRVPVACSSCPWLRSFLMKQQKFALCYAIFNFRAEWLICKMKWRSQDKLT